ncbi:hypothetical protein INR49_015088 [Caranx melampygus]|nr:hypothetical protein INR49_015088 [Caranx melampygus]
MESWRWLHLDNLCLHTVFTPPAHCYCREESKPPPKFHETHRPLPSPYSPASPLAHSSSSAWYKAEVYAADR